MITPMPGKLKRRKLVCSLALLAAMSSGGGLGFLIGRDAAAGTSAPPSLLPLLASGQTVMAETITYPAGSKAMVTAAILALAPGAETGWHTHGVPVFGYVLEGELTVAYRHAGQRVFRAGEALLEAMAVAHNGRNSGTGPMRALAVYMGAEGVPMSRPCTSC